MRLTLGQAHTHHGRHRSGTAPVRHRWLNPPEWFEWVNELVPGYPTCRVPRDEDGAKALKTRTLTNLYNACPQLARVWARGPRCRRRVRLRRACR